MKFKLSFAIVLAVLFGFGVSWSSSLAAGPPDEPAVKLAGDIGPAAAGQLQLSFRYVETFGVTEQGYIADLQHLNMPTGLFIDSGDNLFVVEERGARLLKFRLSDKTNLLNLGIAGMHYLAEDEVVFDEIADVALDHNGNIWAVDGHRAIQLGVTGNLLQMFPATAPWDSGSGNDRFDEPLGIAFDSAGRMYVSDRGNHRIQVFTFDVSGTPVYSTTIGQTNTSGSDNSHFDAPQRIALDSQDRLYVADYYNNRVQRCTYSGSWLCATFHGGANGSGPDELARPAGLGIDSGDNIYIADIYNGRVKKCDSSGTCNSSFITGLSSPADVAVDSSGNVYVSDRSDFTVRKFNSAGAAQGVFLGVSSVPYVTDNSRFNQPEGATVDANGDIYVATNRGYRLLKMNAAGVVQWTIGEPGVWGSDNAHFGDYWNGVRDVAVASDGTVYVVDTGNDRIQIFNNNGSYLTTLGTGYGSGDYEFKGPQSVTIDSGGNIYVADADNHRVQIYNSSQVYVATLGQTGISGSDNSHFDEPHGVAVDHNGNILVADYGNNRVQIFDSSRNYIRSLGVTNVWDNDYDHFSEPRDVAVDAQGRIYVADAWNDRVQVFDSGGSYLNTIGGGWGTRLWEIRGAVGVATDSQGNVYVVDRTNHRLQKFAPGAVGATQVNSNGFGDIDNWGAFALGVFNNSLYIGTGNHATGTELYRTTTAGSWTQVASSGFGDSTNVAIDWLAEYNGMLYVATWNETDTGTTGGQIWRSLSGASGSWEQVVSGGFGDLVNGEIMHLVGFNGHLYAGTWSYDQATHGTEIWRSSSGNSNSWSKVADDATFGNSDNRAVLTSAIFNNTLYVGTWGDNTGGEIWRSTDGLAWSQANSDGFGNANNREIMTLYVFNNQLYAGTFNETDGGEIWRSSDGTNWSRVVSGGFDDPSNTLTSSLIELGNQLYAIIRNDTTGTEVWRSASGEPGSWKLVADNGFGMGDATDFANSIVTFDEQLYVGTRSPADTGAKVWALSVAADVYLPLVVK